MEPRVKAFRRRARLIGFRSGAGRLEGEVTPLPNTRERVSIPEFGPMEGIRTCRGMKAPQRVIVSLLGLAAVLIMAGLAALLVPVIRHRLREAELIETFYGTERPRNDSL